MSEEKKEKPLCSKEELRLLYTQLLEGVTKVKDKDIEGYIKHNSAFDSNKVDVVRFESLEKAKNEGFAFIPKPFWNIAADDFPATRMIDQANV